MRRISPSCPVALLVLGFLLAFIPPANPSAASEGVFFVKPDGSDTACTQAWPCSMATALSRASTGATIYFAQGTYIGVGTAVITLDKSLTLLGAWDGEPTPPPRRSPNLYPSILDGENQRRVIDISGDVSPTIEGFNIVRGYGDYSGGGIRVEDASPILRYNTIRDNHADGDGGAIFVNRGSAQILFNWIEHNTATWSGGLRLINDAQVTVVGNYIHENTAAISGGGVDVSCCGGVTALVARNLIADNQGANYGGGILVETTRARLVNNILDGNHAQKGAGVWLDGMQTHPTHADLFNNTLLGKEIGQAVWANQYVEAALVNDILAGFDTSLQDNSPATNMLEIDYNLFWNNAFDPLVGTHAVLSNPLLDALYHLKAGSPAINAGRAVDLAEDFDGFLRPVGAFDIGADEYALQVYLPLGLNLEP